MLQSIATIGLNIKPPFYYHLIQWYPIPTKSWIVSLLSTCLLFVCINATIFGEILKKNNERKLFARAETGLNEKRKSLVSIIVLVLLAGCTVAAFIHYLFIVETPEASQNESSLLTFAFYFLLEGFLAPTTVILSVENLRNYLMSNITEIWNKFQNVFACSCKIPSAEVVPIV